MRTARKSTFFITAIVLAVGLTGCSGGGQSVADACKLITDEGAEISNDAQELMGSVATDPDGAVDALGDIQDRFEKLSDKIDNAEVKPVFAEFVSVYGEFGKLIGEAAADPASATDAMAKVTESSTKITDASKKLQEVCS